MTTAQKPKECEHKNFTARVNVNRLEDTKTFSADVRIECAECHLPFCFIGMDSGLNRAVPMVSPDAREARMPIYPQGEIHREDTVLAGFKVLKAN